MSRFAVVSNANVEAVIEDKKCCKFKDRIESVSKEECYYIIHSNFISFLGAGRTNHLLVVCTIHDFCTTIKLIGWL